MDVIKQEIQSEDWDIIGIGGLTTVYSRIKELASVIRKSAPSSLFIGGGGWSSYNPDEILQLIPEIDMLVIGEGEETFAELYDHVSKNKKNFDEIKITFYGFEDEEPISLTLLMDGFTQALDNINQQL